MQPVQVLVDASHSSFQMYKSGVYDDPDCSTSGLDHTMLLVGYGTAEDGKDYWILKNSWGECVVVFTFVFCNNATGLWKTYRQVKLLEYLSLHKNFTHKILIMHNNYRFFKSSHMLSIFTY